jgi:4-amino-4-deoxy-L-arabinose transferase-like glycosyltransferase
MFGGTVERRPITQFLCSGQGTMLLLLVAAIARLLWIGSFDWIPWSDADWYHRRAIELAQGLGYNSGERPTAYFPIGYPGFLAGLFLIFPSTQTTVALANAALGVATVAASLALYRELGLSQITSRIAALLVALCPTLVLYASLEMSETLFTFLLVLASYQLLVSRRKVWASVTAGLLFGAATLVRSQVLLLPAAMLCLLLLMRRDAVRRVAQSGAILYLALACVVLPWTLRNWIVLGIPALVSTNDGANLLLGNHPTQRWGSGDPVTPPIAADLEGVRYTEGHPPADEAAWDRRVRARAWTYIRQDPVHSLLLAPRKLQRHFSVDTQIFDQNERQARAAGDDITWLMPVLGPVQTVWHETMLGLFLLALCYAVPRPDLRWPILFCALPAAYFAALSAVFFGEARYNFPALPFLLGGAVIGAAAVLRSLTALGLRAARLRS